MAASVTTTATTLEGQLLEIAQAISHAELGVPDEERPNNIQIAVDVEGGQLTITAVLPVTFTGSGGELKATPTPYI